VDEKDTDGMKREYNQKKTRQRNAESCQRQGKHEKGEFNFRNGTKSCIEGQRSLLKGSPEANHNTKNYHITVRRIQNEKKRLTRKEVDRCKGRSHGVKGNVKGNKKNTEVKREKRRRETGTHFCGNRTRNEVKS